MTVSPGRRRTKLDREQQEAPSPPKRSLRRLALLARFPKLGRQLPLGAQWPSDSRVAAPSHSAQYPALADDLKVWTERVETPFRRLDHRAQILQNQFWRQHLTLIGGGLAATSLGAVQAAVGGGVESLAALQALLTGALAGATVLVRSRRAQHGYLVARLKAERIKSEFFVFLARAGEYAGNSREARLHERIEDIEAAEDGA